MSSIIAINSTNYFNEWISNFRHNRNKLLPCSGIICKTPIWSCTKALAAADCMLWIDDARTDCIELICRTRMNQMHSPKREMKLKIHSKIVLNWPVQTICFVESLLCCCRFFLLQNWLKSEWILCPQITSDQILVVHLRSLLSSVTTMRCERRETNMDLSVWSWRHFCYSYVYSLHTVPRRIDSKWPPTNEKNKITNVYCALPKRQL